MNNEVTRIWKEDLDVTKGTISELASSNCGNPRDTSVSVVNVPIKIQLKNI
jgi:hypothetical protein